MIGKRVKIVKDTVSHRIPIGNIVRIKSESEKTTKRGKKCYNVLDLNCYVSEEDVEILSDLETEKERPVLINEKSLYEKEKELNKTEPSTWFDEYSDAVVKKEPPKKIKKGDRVWSRNVIALTPNGTQMRAKDGYFLVYEFKNKRYWLRRDDKNDLNEYFCDEKDVKLSETKTSSF